MGGITLLEECMGEGIWEGRGGRGSWKRDRRELWLVCKMNKKLKEKANHATPLFCSKTEIQRS